MLIQEPSVGAFLLKWQGETIAVALRGASGENGKAVFRANISGEWRDYSMKREADGVYRVKVKLDKVGIFSGKACWFKQRSYIAEWPEGENITIKVQSALTKRNNSIYTVFARQFGSFREVVRRLPIIMDRMGFRIIQTLPPFPVPTTYAVMGEYGCPFAATDFYAVDPAMAEFDEAVTPIDQFRELIDAVHSRRGLFFIDLPANHTGWGSVLQSTHPEWFVRDNEGRFVSPGAWGVKWADLVKLDYSKKELWEYMADVFIAWCARGVDGFRCDAGYMIPAEAWEYIVARVREQYADIVFMLEGLGGDIALTDHLLAASGLDWAYSEVFQTYDRAAFEWYLPSAIMRAEKFGALIHFAETHDNDRLAKKGEIYSRLRVQLAALLSWQGGWGITNGVEWFATEKIDVHGKNDLNWGNSSNMLELIAKLNFILSTNDDFCGASHLELITRGDGNTLAVMRNSSVLILANLDCDKPIEADFDRVKYPFAEAFELITERKVSLGGKVHLGAGEVMCLSNRKVSQEGAKALAIKRARGKFHYVLPRDLKREVVVVGGETLEISAPNHFRARLVGDNDFCYGFARSDDDNRAIIEIPRYSGNGESCQRYELEIMTYSGGVASRNRSTVKLAPRAELAKVITKLDGLKCKEHIDSRVILSNGAGAMSQLRIDWGAIKSQYDAILAANPNMRNPSDRINLWARARMWIQCDGVVSEFKSEFLDGFEYEPSGSFAMWRFVMPCGVGKRAAFKVMISLKRGVNAARLVVRRDDEIIDNAVAGDIRLVVRPDIEWRSFHSTTKAYLGLEELFSRSVSSRSDGFTFTPYEGAFVLKVNGAKYHNEPEWSYNVAHEEEAARGQDNAGDLFSPGWISADLKVGSEVVVTGEFGECESGEWPKVDSSREYDFEQALREAMKLYIVRRDKLKTVIAGYPWFLDWGRDTFIFMRGMIAAGMYEDSLNILKAFAAFEENGTLPNIIYGDSAGNRDTTDAQLWFIRCVKELGEAVGANKIAKLKSVCKSIVENYISGTPNGIKVDCESALVWSPSHFTWMDTNYPAATPREGYPIEIQALWISALRYLDMEALASKALESVIKYFKLEGGGYADCLNAKAGVSARAAIKDCSVRPNQIFLVSLGILEDESILDVTEELLISGGIRSLSSASAGYRGRYEGDEDTSRKPAYHNGTVWAWPFPQYAEAAYRLGRLSANSARSLLASAVDNLNAGALAHISEIADGDTPHAQKGCAAQAWSVSELLRVWLITNVASE